MPRREGEQGGRRLIPERGDSAVLIRHAGPAGQSLYEAHGNARHERRYSRRKLAHGPTQKTITKQRKGGFAHHAPMGCKPSARLRKRQSSLPSARTPCEPQIYREDSACTGNFLPLLNQSFGLTDEAARVYMRVATEFWPNSKRRSGFELQGASRQVAGSSSSARANRKAPVKGKKAAAQVLDGRLLLCGHRWRDALCPTANKTSKKPE